MHGRAVAQRALCKVGGRFEVLAVINRVMTAASISASRGGGYARYLESKTVVPERGDYYLTTDGEMAQAPGRWLADAETLDRLGIVTGEPLDGADFIALMEGRHPGTGRWLRPEGAGGGRGGGIDVTLSAPKSISTYGRSAIPGSASRSSRHTAARSSRPSTTCESRCRSCAAATAARS